MANGNKFWGYWERSKRQGEGRYAFAEGHEYTGSFEGNRFSGRGTMRYSNGDTYAGGWANDRPSGYGTYSFRNGTHYQGQLLEGKFHGTGTFWFADGSRHEGYWLFNKRHGSGTLVYSNGLATQGYWKDGYRTDSGEDIAQAIGTPLEVIPGEQVRVEERSARDFQPISNVAAMSQVRIWAVLVGVGRYDYMPALRYTDDDAYQMYAFLKSPEGGALPDQQISLLIDEDATRANVLNSMEEVFSRAGTQDVIIFYFSGHGLEDAFLPVDYDGVNNRVEHRDVKELMEQSRAKHKLVVADACHSGGLFTAKGVDVSATLELLYTAFLNTNGGMALLLSSKKEELSHEDRGLRSGVFSYFFIRGLKGEADANNDKVITVTELHEYLKLNVRHYTAGAQTPVISGAYDPRMPVGVRR
jgi:hypothetical protein